MTFDARVSVDEFGRGGLYAEPRFLELLAAERLRQSLPGDPNMSTED